jgi:TorA maturation chaperone TorD
MPIPGERLRLLAALLAAPEAGSLDVLEELAADHPWLQRPAAELRALPLEEWQYEHGRLFICGHPHTVCSPFESAQRHGSMFGPAVDELTRLYRGIGLEASDLPADFLGTELECAALLADDGNHPEAERALWQEHLLCWLPKFAETLEKESRLSVYAELGRQLGAVCGQAGHA